MVDFEVERKQSSSSSSRLIYRLRVLSRTPGFLNLNSALPYNSTASEKKKAPAGKGASEKDRGLVNDKRRILRSEKSS